MMAAGGTQLKKIMEDDGIYVWTFHVDWKDPSKTKVDGPRKIAVAPYHYLCDGQLTNCVPQPGAERRLDAQGDKIMARLVYRRIGNRESIVAVHSVNTSSGGGGVRWYEFRVDRRGNVDAAPAGHLRARGVLSLDGEPGDRREGQHRHRLLVRRDAALRRPAFRGPAVERPERAADARRDGPRRGRGGADQHAALGGLHADRHRPERRLHDLVRRRLHQERTPRTTRPGSARFECRDAGSGNWELGTGCELGTELAWTLSWSLELVES